MTKALDGWVVLTFSSAQEQTRKFTKKDPLGIIICRLQKQRHLVYRFRLPKMAYSFGNKEEVHRLGD
ncbi:hypothetical protein SDJN03_27569, partial [Cucurbita argyrosperma subsp. sororia]